MTTERRSQIIESLKDKDVREYYVAEHIAEGLAFQVKALREARGWTQAELGQRAKMAQERISQLEDPNYGKPTLSTLRRLAAAFDVALVVRLAPFSELVDWTTHLTPESLAPKDFDNDLGCAPSKRTAKANTRKKPDAA